MERHLLVVQVTLDLTQSSKGPRETALVFAFAARIDSLCQVAFGIAKPLLQSCAGRFSEQVIDRFGHDGKRLSRICDVQASDASIGNGELPLLA
jgi:hypothetical protein